MNIETSIGRDGAESGELSGQYSRAELYDIIYDLHEKIAELQSELPSERDFTATHVLDTMYDLTDESLLMKIELFRGRLSELEKKKRGRLAVVRTVEITIVQDVPVNENGLQNRKPQIPEDVLRIREGFLEEDTPKSIEDAAELWQLKFGDTLPTAALLVQLFEERLYFSPEIIEELGGVDALCQAVERLMDTTLHVRRPDKNRTKAGLEMPHRWDLATMQDAADLWKRQFPDEIPTGPAIAAKHLEGKYPSVTTIQRLGGVRLLQVTLGYKVAEVKEIVIDEVKMQKYVEAWKKIFPGLRPTRRLIDEKYAQNIPGWVYTSQTIIRAGGIEEFRRRLGYIEEERPTLRSLAEEWYEKFGMRKPTKLLIVKLASEGKFATYSMVRSCGGVTQLQAEIEVVRRLKRKSNE